MKIETDGLSLGDVAGIKYRLVPLVVRWTQRRRVTKETSVGSPVTVTLAGEVTADGNIMLAKGAMLPPTNAAPEDGKTILLDGRTILTIPATRVKRVERRVGAERRK